MVLDSGVKTHDTSLKAAIKRGLMLKAVVSNSHDRVFSQAFIRRHTQFDSVEAFCAACPCDDDTIGGVQRIRADERDAFVERTTEFETWEEMKRGAAVEDLVTLQNA